ncbi:MAG: radical SAM protein [Pseudomonadota bacterium]
MSNLYIMQNEHDMIRKELFSNIGFITLSVTNLCNGACKYCYMPIVDKKRKSEFLSHDLLRQVLNAILVNNFDKKRALKLQFFGGEPLLVGLDWYKKALPIIRNIAKESNIDIELVVQSNFINVNREIIEYFEKEDIILNASLDGNSKLHDILASSGERIIKNIKLFYNITGRAPGIITVLGKHNASAVEEILEYFIKDLKIDSINVLFLHNKKVLTDSFEANSDEMLACSYKILDTMKKQKGKFIETNLKRYLLMYFDHDYNEEERSKRNCHSFYCMAFRNMCSIFPDGEILGCDAINSNRRQRGLYIQDFYKDPKYFSKAYNKMAISFHEKGEAYSKCLTCFASKICSFNCPGLNKNYEYHEKMCEYTKKLFKYFEINRKSLISLYNIIKDKNLKINKMQLDDALKDTLVNVEDKNKIKNALNYYNNQNEAIFNEKYRVNELINLFTKLDSAKLIIEKQTKNNVFIKSRNKRFIYKPRSLELYKVDPKTYMEIILSE